jgi:hypothetical protein
VHKADNITTTYELLVVVRVPLGVRGNNIGNDGKHQKKKELK